MDAQVRQWFMDNANQLHVFWTADYSSIAFSMPHSHRKAETVLVKENRQEFFLWKAGAAKA